MGKQKLTNCIVVRIKRQLQQGVTHTELGKKYGVSRSQISKIWKGMNDPNHKNSRWGEVEI